MRIGLAIYKFNPSKGGAERYAFDLASRLRDKGHDVLVFCSQGLDIPGIQTIRLNTLTYPKWLRTLSFALSHRARWRSFNLDIALGFGNTLEAHVYQSHGGVQKVWMERELASYPDRGERAWKALLLKTSLHQKVQQLIAEHPLRSLTGLRVVAISDMIKTHMVEHFNLKASSVNVVYNGVDTLRFMPGEATAAGPLHILFSAANFRLKGLLPLIKALSAVARQRSDFHLTVMGRGRPDSYRALIDQWGLTDHVTFLGETGSPESVYRQAHILAHPTYYDACSLTTMEGMASGLPAISTRWNGSSALISPECGFVLDEPDDVPALTSALLGLFDVEQRSLMGREARRIIEGYTMKENADRMEEIFFEVQGGR
jgi:UDP-glucose:(heptosyl)LPS alpha-1,3-glucosyltransferase